MFSLTQRICQPFSRPLTRLPSVQTIRRLSLPPSKAEDTPDIKQTPYTREFPSAFTQVVYVLRRFLKISAVSVIFVGSAAILLFQGTHLYVEKVLLASEGCGLDPNTSDISLYEWDQEMENWTGPPGIGGTDPKLSWRARQALRSAWMNLYWGNIVSNSSLSNEAPYDGRLLSTLLYLDVALQSSSDPRTRTMLLELQGNVASALSSKKYLEFANSRYREALEGVPTDSLHAAKLCASIADVLTRLGRVGEAVDTCWKSIRIIEPAQSPSDFFNIPVQRSHSPAATRLLFRNMTTLSALYASFKDLESTFSFQSSLLESATNMASDPDSTSTSPSGLLHNMYLQQRIATLQIHLAEVHFAITQQSQEAVKLLSTAGASSERIAMTLVGNDVSVLDQLDTHPELVPTYFYLSSKALAPRAATLLFDASRSAATAYRLSSLLLEKRGDLHSAFVNIEKALWWCGGVEGPSPNIPTAEWESVWSDYTKLRRLTYTGTQ